MIPAAARFEGPHFFVAPRDVDSDGAVLRGPQARHLLSVLRARPGDLVSLADGQGALYQARLRAMGAEAALDVLDRAEVDAPSPRVTVIHALPKARKLDEVIQRLTELGVDAILPVHSARSQVRLNDARADKSAARWRAVALAAAKQSRRARLPLVGEPGDWASALGRFPDPIVLWEHARTPLVAQLGAAASADELALAIGPEGGLEAGEVAGRRSAWLGPTILRTETAAVAAASIALALAGRMG